MPLELCARTECLTHFQNVFKSVPPQSKRSISRSFVRCGARSNVPRATIPAKDSGRPTMQILVEYFCMQLWHKLVEVVTALARAATARGARRPVPGVGGDHDAHRRAAGVGWRHA